MTGPTVVVPNPTEVTFINSLPNFILSSKLMSVVVLTLKLVTVVPIPEPTL